MCVCVVLDPCVIKEYIIVKNKKPNRLVNKGIMNQIISTKYISRRIKTSFNFNLHKLKFWSNPEQSNLYDRNSMSFAKNFKWLFCLVASFLCMTIEAMVFLLSGV